MGSEERDRSTARRARMSRLANPEPRDNVPVEGGPSWVRPRLPIPGKEKYRAAPELSGSTWVLPQPPDPLVELVAEPGEQ